MLSITTPFGFPVDPDVKLTYKGSNPIALFLISANVSSFISLFSKSSINKIVSLLISLANSKCSLSVIKIFVSNVSYISLSLVTGKS